MILRPIATPIAKPEGGAVVLDGPPSVSGDSAPANALRDESGLLWIDENSNHILT